MVTALVIIHVIIAVVLTVIVLMQHGRQQGLSGAIAGGAETFFGKNKGRTIDAMLRKFTAVFAILFILSSIVLTYISIRQANIDEEANDAAGDETSQTMNVTMDESGNLVDESGNIVMSAEDMAAQEAAMKTQPPKTQPPKTQPPKTQPPRTRPPMMQPLPMRELPRTLRAPLISQQEQLRTQPPNKPDQNI